MVMRKALELDLMIQFIVKQVVKLNTVTKTAQSRQIGGESLLKSIRGL